MATMTLRGPLNGARAWAVSMLSSISTSPVRQGKLTVAESRQFLRFYENGLEGYTYLEEPSA